MTKFAKFGQHLMNLARGEEVSIADQTIWQRRFAEAEQYLNSVIDVQCTTLSNYFTPRIHNSIRPRAVIVKEAGKATEMETIGAYLLNDCPHLILVGNVYQLPPYIEDMRDTQFAPQESISLFNRLQLIGYPAYLFKEQHRYPASINELLKVLGVKDLCMHPAVMQRPEVQKAQKFISRHFKIPNTNHVFIEMDGASSFNPYNTTSKVNNSNLRIVMYFLVRAIEDGWSPDQICIATPYSAQRSEYLSELQKLVKQIIIFEYTQFNREALNRLSQAIRADELSVVTWNSVHGQEKEIVFADLRRSTLWASYWDMGKCTLP